MQYSTLHLIVRHRDVTRRLNKQALISGRFKSGFQFAISSFARELFALSKWRLRRFKVAVKISGSSLEILKVDLVGNLSLPRSRVQT